MGKNPLIQENVSKFWQPVSLVDENGNYVSVGDIDSTGEKTLTFVKKLDTVGDGTGSTNQNVDGSSTPIIFKVKPASGEILNVTRIIFLLRDNSSFDSGGWGALGGTPLTNGCQLGKKIDGVDYKTFELKSNADIAGLCFDISHNNWGSGDEFLTARFTFTKLGAPIRLIGDNGDELNFTINDDLTGLTDQYITAEGYFENKLY